MATAAERQAARDVSLVFHAALVAYGMQTLADSYEGWQDVQPVPNAVQASGARWFEAAVLSAMGRNRRSRAMAVSYIRYHRALHTGFTLPPGPPDPLAEAEEGAEEPREAGPTESLANLRTDFYGAVRGLVPDLLTEDDELVDEESGEVVTDPPPRNNFQVPVDRFDMDRIIRGSEERIEREAEAELLSTGLLNLQALIREVDDTLPAVEVDRIREDAHAQAGARQAAAAERIALAGARDIVAEVAREDERAIGYIRVSGTGSPCGWCAMLISRGAQFYRSEKAAGTASGRGRGPQPRKEGETFHENCKCYVEPVYSTEQYEEDDRFDLNRQLATEWAEVTAGLRGKQALAVWRRYIRKRSTA